MKKINRLIIVAIIIFASTKTVAQDNNVYKIIKTFHIKSSGGWDYIAVGPGNNRLYVSHGTQVNILDKTNGDSVGIIENTTGVHGISFDKATNKGFTSNGRINNVTVFDLKTNAIITQIATGENPDAILFEPYSGKIITCNGRSKDLSVIDPKSDKLIATIPLDGKPEAAVSDGTGQLFVNIEDKNEIAVVNTKSYSVKQFWPIAPGEEPTGLALDKKNNRLFSGCGNQLLIVVDATNGKIINKLPIGRGCDGVKFDESTNNIFTSNGEGTLSVFHEATPDSYQALATVKTKRGARTIALDEQTHWIYLPTAEFEEPNPNAPNGRRQMKPGTFQVLVLSK